MSFMKKTLGFMAGLAVLPASYALTSRPSVIGTASSRMPTMTAYITNSGTTTSGSTTTTSSLLANAECIDAYTACMKGGDACGPEFEECTTKVLFHGKMPQCLSTLAQCSTAGVTSLFGTGTVSALSAVATKNSYGEVTDYTYPTEGSVLGQMITGAAITNKYDTSTCVRRYTSCLKKESVCGNDFELCTTDKEFRKQRVFCDSTLARCQSEGIIELFGSANTSTVPSATSRIGEMITEGAALAAVNAVATCYKVVDQCILNACAANPYKCYENSSQTTVTLVDAINDGTGAAENTAAMTSVSTLANAGMDMISKSNIASYIKNSCLDTIGSNKYCYATFIGNGQMPTASQLRDEDNQEEVYDEAYSARMNAAMRSKIADLVDKFDTKAKQKCTDTIKSCVMRVCGSGSGAACYSQVFGNRDKSINNSVTYPELQTGCAAVVNTDVYCKYAAANPNATGGYSYTYINNDAFGILFPEYEEGGSDPIGVISTLNAALANNYSDAALAQMKRQCQSVATSCVKSMCGSDYQNCYRNRTDVYSSLTNTGESSFDKSMNKVGGVLDYTIVLGLCLDTVKAASVCEEHLAIERNKLKIAKNSSVSSWGGAGTVREGWIDAGSATAITADTEQVAAVDENGNALCTTAGGTDQGVCNTVDASGKIFDQPIYISYTTYIESQAASTLFKDLIYDLEKEAQAKYNAKLTKQQNMCMSANQGGIMGNRDMGSTFMWVKLKSNNVPKSYATTGLKANQFAASNDLYGSFCRVRVTLQSDDKQIQDTISKGADWATAYFAAGDTFTCGSWIPGSAIEKMASAVGSKARNQKANEQADLKGWMTLVGVVGGGTLGGFGIDKAQDGAFLGGLLGNGNSGAAKSKKENAERCVNLSYQYSAADAANKSLYLSQMLMAARNAGVDTSAAGPIAKLQSAMGTTNQTVVTCEVKAADYTDTTVDVFSYGSNKLACPKNSGVTITDIARVSTNSGLPYVNITLGSDNVNSSELTTAVANLGAACSEIANTKDSNADRTRSITTAVGAGVSAIAGGILANKITGSIQDAARDKAEQDAIKTFMDEIGSHIRCFVGSDEVGMYGDIISTSME